MVVWIEIQNCPMSVTIFWSPPAWWCGLKYNLNPRCTPQYLVTTCVVVWIEILFQCIIQHCIDVTTCVVVWIEIEKVLLLLMC